MQVSVAICTQDRAGVLGGCLDALARLRIPHGSHWEVLVVNNACRDGTDEVIAERRGRLPLRRLAEPRPGLSLARNRVLDEAVGELLLFTDDDVRPEVEWLAEHVRVAAVNPRAVFTGGPVEPEFLASPPSWFSGNPDICAGVLALRPAAGRPLGIRRIRTAEDLPCGANFGLRPSRLRGLRFDPDLGRRGPGPGVGEETDLLLRILGRGEEGIWIPSASVRHLVGADRLAASYFAAWFRAFGRASAVRHPDRVPGRLRLRARWLMSRTAAALASPRKGPRWMRAWRRAAKAEGMLDWHAVRRRTGAAEEATSAAR